MNFSISIFKGFFAYFLATATLRNVLNGCFCIKYKFYNVAHTHDNSCISLLPEAYSEHIQTSKMQFLLN